MGLADLFKKKIQGVGTPTMIGLPTKDKVTPVPGTPAAASVTPQVQNTPAPTGKKVESDPFTKGAEVATAGSQVKKPGEAKQFVEGLVSIKDIIAPSAIEVDFNHIRIDNKYFRTLFVAGYPRFVGLNWLSTLINFDASMKVAMYIYPTDGKEILDDLRRKIAEMEAEISTDIQRGRVVNPATQAKLEDALNLQTDLVKGEERFFQYGLYMTVSAKTKDELDRSSKNLESALGALMIISKKASLQMEEGFNSTLPLCADKLSVTRNMDTTSLASTFPFVSSDLSDDKGIMYGINEHNGSLVIFDRFSMQNYNSVVFASAGAGKSYMIKLEAMRSLMLGTDIIVIDPENEYQSLAESVGGQYIAFGYGEASKINPFDLSLVVEEGENALNDKVLTLHKMFKIMIGAMDPIEESILDKAVMEAYKAKGITPDPETQKKEAPLIEDLYKALIGMEEERARNLSARLEKYIKGSFAGIFNQKTTVNLKNGFVVFGIRNLEESLRPVAMHIILDYIWTIVKKELKRRILIVDEAWYLMQYEDSAAFLRGIVKRGRKYYLGVTTITQDVDDFLETAYGKEIVTNSAIQILLKQHSAAIDKVGETFYLSEGEKQLLLSADKGEGIFFAGQNHVAIQVIASEEEHNLITSNPEDILRKRIAEKQAALAKQALPTTNPSEEEPVEEKKLPPLPETPVKPEEKSNPTPPAAASPFDPPEAGRQGDLKTEEKPLAVPAEDLGGIKMEEVKNEKINSEEENSKVVSSGEAKIEEDLKLNPLPTQGGSVTTDVGMSEEKKTQEPFDKGAMKVEIEESPEEIMKKRIAELEINEKKELEEHRQKLEKEAQEAKSTITNNAPGTASLPKYQELFKSPSAKLPPLPPLPKFEAPKQSANLPKFEVQKPTFMTQTKEPVIPQPPQLTKKPKVEFIPTDSSAVVAGGEDKKPEEPVKKEILSTETVKVEEVKAPETTPKIEEVKTPTQEATAVGGQNADPSGAAIIPPTEIKPVDEKSSGEVKPAEIEKVEEKKTDEVKTSEATPKIEEIKQNPPPSTADTSPVTTDKPEEKPTETDDAKMTYEKLFGNDKT
ncbi:MAG TPA: ATP-binding protein [Candidatus Methanoperedens sp.]|nr:ATP-binding protein [Candidatus Methanoperedens sp.]